MMRTVLTEERLTACMLYAILLSWAGKHLNYCIANLFRAMYTKFHQYRRGFVEDMTKTFWCVFSVHSVYADTHKAAVLFVLDGDLRGGQQTVHVRLGSVFPRSQTLQVVIYIHHVNVTCEI